MVGWLRKLRGDDTKTGDGALQQPMQASGRESAGDRSPDAPQVVSNKQPQAKAPDEFSEAGIREALKDVRDPEIGRDLISLNMIRGIQIEGSSVVVGVALTTGGCPLKHQITGDIQDRLKMIPGVEQVDVDFDVMTDTERQDLFTTVHGKPDEPAPAFKDDSRTRVIAVVSGKGGVGKSTVAVNLAAALSREGYSVAILDADVHGSSVPVMLGSLARPNVVDGVIFPVEAGGLRFISMGNFVEEGQAIIWRAPIVNKALSQLLRDVYWGEPDFIIVDMPPGTGDVALTVAQKIPKAEALVVTTPQADAARVAVKAGKMAHEAHLKVIGVVENMSYATCPDCGTEIKIFGGDGGDRVVQQLDSRILGRIPILPDASGEPGKALFHADTLPGQAFAGIARNVASMKSRRRLKVL